MAATTSVHTSMQYQYCNMQTSLRVYLRLDDLVLDHRRNVYWGHQTKTGNKLYKATYCINRYSRMTLIFSVGRTTFCTPPPTLHQDTNFWAEEVLWSLCQRVMHPPPPTATLPSHPI